MSMAPGSAYRKAFLDRYNKGGGLAAKTPRFFAQLCQIRRFFLQAFPRIVLVVLSVFNSLQVRQADSIFSKFMYLPGRPDGLGKGRA